MDIMDMIAIGILLVLSLCSFLIMRNLIKLEKEYKKYLSRKDITSQTNVNCAKSKSKSERNSALSAQNKPFVQEGK